MTRILRGTGWIFVILVATRIIAATLLPIIQDEAYYFRWAQYLDWGYFDHPPVVAWVSLTSLIDHNPLVARLGTLILGLLTFPLLSLFYKEVGLNQRGWLPVALVLATLSFGGIIGGLIVAPDVGQIFAWSGALAMAARALNRNPRWWLAAGAFTGLGLLSKYVMLIIGPVFLWGLLRGAPQQLKTPWPYLGGIVALLVLSPHLFWNSQNEWVTVRFQLQHGFTNTHDVEQRDGSSLPVATQAEIGSVEYAIAQNFVDPTIVEEEKKERGPWEQRRRRYEEFIGSQLSLWGLLLVAMVAAWVHAIRQRRWYYLPALPCRPLVYAATTVPLLVFAAVAWSSKVEANWPAIYMIGAAAIFAPPLRRYDSWLYAGAVANALIVVALAVHGTQPYLPIKPSKDRVLRDTAGYKDVAAYMSQLTDTVFFDTYQSGAMLGVYQPDLTIAQWPGITRPSEFTRRRSLTPVTWDQVKDQSSFWLLTANRVPPVIPQFQPVTEQMLAYCADTGFVVIEPKNQPFRFPCRETIVRHWYAVHYRMVK